MTFYSPRPLRETRNFLKKFSFLCYILSANCLVFGKICYISILDKEKNITRISRLRNFVSSFAKIEKPFCIYDAEGRISAVPPSFVSEQINMFEHLMSVNGDEAELLTYLVCCQMFCCSVQKLPSITRDYKTPFSQGRFSLGSLVMYSSFSLPLSIYHCIK